MNTAAPPPQTPRRFATIGAGLHGMSVIDHLLRTGRWQLVAVVDRSAAAYARFQSRFHDKHIPFYATVDEALAAAQPELVYIATTAPGHVPLAKTVLGASFAGHVLIEKPVATSLNEAQDLQDTLTALAATHRAGVNFNRRCSNLYRSAKAVIESGELGRLQHIDYKRAMKLSMKGSHYIDLINWFMGSRPSAVTAWLAADSTVDNRGAYFYDPAGTIEFQYASGQTACLDGLNMHPELADGMRLQFEHGVVQIDAAEKTARLAGPGGERELADDSGLTAFHWIANTFEALVDPTGLYAACSIAEASDSLAVIAAAYQSHQRGHQPTRWPLAAETRSIVLRLA